MSNPEMNNDEMCFVCLQRPSTNPLISMHRIPYDKKLKLLWMEACGLAEEDYTTERRVCSQHFTDNCFFTFKTIRYLFPDAIPSIFAPSNPTTNISNMNPALFYVMEIMNKPNQQLVTKETAKFSPFIYRIESPGNQNYPVKWFCYLCSTFILSENAVKLHLDNCPPRRNLDSSPVDKHKLPLPHTILKFIEQDSSSDSD